MRVFTESETVQEAIKKNQYVQVGNSRILFLWKCGNKYEFMSKEGNVIRATDKHLSEMGITIG